VVCFLVHSNVLGQLVYGGPSGVTYSPDSKKYYVVNQVTKDVNELNKWGQGRKFISGLNSPTNILFANLPIGAGFLILDSNQVHLFDTTGFQVGSENVSGAKRLQDFVFDTKAETLYTTDIERHVIYKTTFGPPPFYIPSTSIFADSLNSPAGIYLDKPNNRLLYTEFVDSSNIKTVDLNTAAIGTLVQTGLDSVIAIDKDLQGNYYLSSQGNKGVYSWNKYLSGAPKRVFYEPKPSDFMINTLTDEWAYLCYSCGKVYIVELHLEGPYYEDMSCAGDSVTTYLNPGLRAIGTYDVGNKFIAELSDDKWNFNSGKNTIVGEASDTLRPVSGIKCYMPKSLKLGTYKLRIRTTKPVGTSMFELFMIYDEPEANAYTADTASICSGSVLQLGVGTDTTISYSWTPKSLVSNDTIARPNFIGNSDSKVYLNTVNKTTGCKNNDSVYVQIVSKPSVGSISDTVQACKGETLELGIVNTDLSFNWSPGTLLNDSTIANPTITELGTNKFTCRYEAKGGCFDEFTQTAIIHKNPSIRILNKEVYFCPNENKSSELLLTVNGNNWDSKQHKLTWYNKSVQISKRPVKLDLSKNGKNYFEIQNIKTKCTIEDSMTVNSFDSLRVNLSQIGLDSLTVAVVGNTTVAKYNWYLNGTLIPGADKSIYVAKDSGEYFVKVRTSDSCFFESTRIDWVKASNSTGFLKNKSNDFYIVENSYGTQLLSRSAFAGEASIWFSSLNGQTMSFLEGVKLPLFIERYSSPGLNIATIIVNNKVEQRIKYVHLK